MQVKRTILLSLTMICAIPAFAQYIWLDEKGVKQFSDMPPPKSIPDSRILKSPNKSISSSSGSSSDSSADTEAVKKQPSLSDQNDAYLKRKAKQAEDDKKAAAAKQKDEAKASNCEKAKSYQRTLDDGVRITNTDANGNRSYMTDEQRAAESARNKTILDDCK